MRALYIAGNAVRRLLRDRSNIFFVFIFPMVLIIVLGASFGGGFTPRLGVVQESDGPFSAALIEQVAASNDINVDTARSRQVLQGEVERGRYESGLVVPADYDETLAAGLAAAVEFVGSNEIVSQQLRTMVEAAVAEQNVGWVSVQALEAATGDERSAILAAAREVRPFAGDVIVVTTATGEAVFPETLGQFDLGASQQLLLFIFLTSLAGSVTLIQSRQWGVIRRMVASPTSATTIVTGEGLGRFGIAMVQGTFIMIGTLLLFGVNWGNPLGAVAVLVLFSAVGAGAGMLVGSTFSNDQQAGSFGIFAALGLAALGGCMIPLEFFPETMQNVAHLTPHAWGLDAFAELVRRDGTIVDIATELAVLALFAVVLISIASWQLGRTLTR